MLSQEQKRKIVLDFHRKNGGKINAEDFVAYLQNEGPDHPAFHILEWDDSAAAHKHRVEQARKFLGGIRINFKVEEVSFAVPAVRFTEGPFVISPLEGRSKGGGGYEILEPHRAEHMRELCSQACMSLRAFTRRYSLALQYSGIDAEALENMAEILNEAKPPLRQAAE